MTCGNEIVHLPHSLVSNLKQPRRRSMMSLILNIWSYH